VSLRRLACAALLLAFACGGPPRAALTPEERALGSDSTLVRARIAKDRARLTQPAELARCAQRYYRRSFDCAMAADTRSVKDCLPGMPWFADDSR